MQTILEEIYRLQNDTSSLDAHERLILKVCANLLEGYQHVPSPQNRLTEEEYFAVPQRWELAEGMLRDYYACGNSATGLPCDVPRYHIASDNSYKQNDHTINDQTAGRIASTNRNSGAGSGT